MNSLASGSMSLIKKQAPILFCRAQQPAGAGTSVPQESRQEPSAEITACQSTGDTEEKTKWISRDLSLGFSSSHFLACAVGQTMGHPLLLLVLDQETMLA